MDKLDAAVARIQLGSEASLKHDGRPLVLTYSGGKDSDAIIEVAKIAGIPFEVEHHHTTADAPETVRHVRYKFRELELSGMQCKISYPMYKGQLVSMWSLIPIKKFPPIRTQRYCCEVLKETSSLIDRYIVTGVRWDESLKRKSKRGIVEKGRRASERFIISNDNDLQRRVMEHCELKGQMIFNPIIDWTTDEVWDFLCDRKAKLNPIYTCSKDRVGCIGCPLASVKKRVEEFRRYPDYKKLYIHAFDRMLTARKAAGKLPVANSKTGYDVFRWWMGDTADQIQFDWYEQEDNNG